jgi:hypothetical protein
MLLTEREKFNEGVQHGYVAGERERVALATANSELRSILLAVRQRLEQRYSHFEILEYLTGEDL